MGCRRQHALRTSVPPGRIAHDGLPRSSSPRPATHGSRRTEACISFLPPASLYRVSLSDVAPKSDQAESMLAIPQEVEDGQAGLINHRAVWVAKLASYAAPLVQTDSRVGRAGLFWAWASEWAGRGEPSPQTGTSELSIFICEQKCSGTSCRCQASTFI